MGKMCLTIILFFIFLIFRSYLNNQVEISKNIEREKLLQKYIGNPKAVDSIIKSWKIDSIEKSNQPLYIPF